MVTLWSIISPNITIRFSGTEQTKPHYTRDKKTKTLWNCYPQALELVVDYGWLWFIAQPLFWLLKFIQTYVGNWGFAIILVTVVVKRRFLSAICYCLQVNG